MPYLYLYVLSLFGGLLSISKHHQVRFFTSFLLIVSIVLVVALRYASVDYFGYLRIYDGLEFDLDKLGLWVYELNASTPVESGFALFNLIIKKTFNSFYLVVALFAIASLAIKFTAFKKFSPYFLISILLYLSEDYFWNDLGQIRNGMAAGIVLWALYFAYHKKPLRFLLLVFLAVQMHSAAVVALPFYFVRYFNSRYLMTLVLFGSIGVAVLFGGAASLLLDIGTTLGFDSSSRLLKYADSKYSTGIALFGGTFFLRLTVAVLMIWFYFRLSAKWHFNHFLIPVYVYTVSILFLFNDYAIIGGRVYDMLGLSVACVVIPSFLLLLNKQSRIFGFGAIVLYCLIWIIALYSQAAPYQSILNS